jgi:hypothetical protein
MATKNTKAEKRQTEEEEEILPELTGMAIEVHIRRHIQFIFMVPFCRISYCMGNWSQMGRKRRTSAKIQS